MLESITVRPWDLLDVLDEAGNLMSTRPVNARRPGKAGRVMPVARPVPAAFRAERVAEENT
jgi:hypothetical protein